MANFNYSALPATNTLSNFLSTDTITFDNDSVQAGSGVFTVNTAGDLVLTIASKTFTFTGITSIDGLNASNFIFSNGGQFVFGDISDNLIVSSIYSDYIDGKIGIDTVSYEKAASSVYASLAVTTAQNTLGGGIDTLLNIENLTGSVYSDTLIGNANANILDGGAGIDILNGGSGNDTYYIDSALDSVIEAAGVGTGTDTVNSNVDYLLAANVENLILLANATNGFGNTLNNVITGNAKNNILNGGTGADLLIGLGGDDTYQVDNILDVADESTVGSSGIDTVEAIVSYTIGNNIENLKLIGAAAINGTGNSGNNTLFANYGNNTLDGAGGNDTVSYLYGTTRGVSVDLSLTTGQNTLGSGTDTLTNIENLTGSNYGDVLSGDANANILNGGNGNDLLNGKTGSDTLIGGNGNDTYIVSATSGYNIIETGGQGIDTIQTDVTFNLSSSAMFANIENLTLTGTGAVNATGNILDNKLVGNSGINSLVGGNGNDFLDGGSGADNLTGGSGNDTYVVDNASDVVFENAADGTDTIQTTINFTLSANTENMTLIGTGAISGTGNSDANILTGNDANNGLYGGDGADKLYGGLGNDILDGGTGIDVLVGGDGNDSYYVDSLSDSVVENTKLVAGSVAGTTVSVQEGVDTVFSVISYKISSANVENLTLLGTSNNSATGTDLNNIITGNTGNNLLSAGGGNDTINGDAGNDTLDGGKGADRMLGGIGDDTYIVDDITTAVKTTAGTVTYTGDRVIENAGEGYDTVMSSVTFTLAANVDALVLTGTNAVVGNGNADDNKLIGNTANNKLTGGAGNDLLDGGAGIDILTGGTGNDIFRFSTLGDSKVTSPDIITDFTSGQDSLNFANLHTAAQPLTLLAAKGSDYTHVAGEIKFAASGLNSVDTTVSIDINGDATADFSVILTGFSANLTLSDFVV